MMVIYDSDIMDSFISDTNHLEAVLSMAEAKNSALLTGKLIGSGISKLNNYVLSFRFD